MSSKHVYTTSSAPARRVQHVVHSTTTDWASPGGLPTSRGRIKATFRPRLSDGVEYPVTVRKVEPQG